MSFSLDVKDFCDRAKKNPETVMRAVSLKLFSAIIQSSPVDTGRFRMNWQAAGPVPRGGIVAGEDKTGSSATASAQTFITNSSAWQEFTLTNNLPYANVIEFGGYTGDGPNTSGGFSKQAPKGVVRVNITRFNTLLNEEAAKVK